jgi:phosphohistidine phosphatase
MDMKQLFLLRHAKSSWDDLNLDDFDRPLNDRGKKAAPLMGKVIRERKLKPDLILCSPSKRTKQTIKLVSEAAEFKTKVAFEERIYEASSAQLLEVLKEQGGKSDAILLVGHNPGMADLLTTLTGALEPFPTAALAAIDLDIEKWKAITGSAGKLRWIVRPKELKL